MHEYRLEADENATSTQEEGWVKVLLSRRPVRKLSMTEYVMAVITHKTDVDNSNRPGKINVACRLIVVAMDDGSSVAVAMDKGHGVDKGLSVNEYLVRPEDEEDDEKGKSGFNESRKIGHKKVQQQKPVSNAKSNRQEKYKKEMPLAAKRLKIQKRKRQKKMKQRRACKQFGTNQQFLLLIYTTTRNSDFVRPILVLTCYPFCFDIVEEIGTWDKWDPV
ncbi:hypothetical protein Tco_0403459 [Tanacetum coccineum]